MIEQQDAEIASIAAKNGFSLKKSYPLKEIDGQAHVLFHESSGAKLLYLKNLDPNKSFSITFKTPAADDTGVFHILEHSVLCGSARYPVKEPFVNLLKTSMQTFLNAMTFPDKTMYPVASTNEADLMNLMSVYLDAVFYPEIYRKETIFRQEGWHLEFAEESGSKDGEDDAASFDDSAEGCADKCEGKREGKPRLVYNGVVFNEMKGALSEPDSVLYDTLSASLFPDTTYRFESGGTPEAIPELTYEAFLDSHRRHYRPDNSYIVLYGDLDLDRFLGFIDSEYLTPIASAADALAAEGHLPKPPNLLEIQSPVISEGVVRKMDTAKENSCAAFGYVVGAASEHKRIVATDILLDAIMGSNVAPLKRAILKAGIANDCSGALMDSIAQPFAMIQLKGLRDGAIEKCREIIRDEVSKLASGSLDRKVVEAALSHAEFVMREHNFGCADGVIYSMTAMGSWLYDDELPTAYIEFEDVFVDLRNDLEKGYFEELLKSIFLENNHYAQVEVLPVPGEGNTVLQKRLEALEDEMDPEAFARIASELEELREAQDSPDSDAALATLPQLSLEDIGCAPAEPGFARADIAGMQCIRHDVETNGIAYFYRYFDMSGIAFDDIAYATVLTMVLGKLDTSAYTASELDTLIQDKLGNLGFAVEVYEGSVGNKNIFPKFAVSSSSLEANADFAASIVEEIVGSTDFTDAAKIQDILVQRRVMMEQRFASAGNAVAVSRANSYYSRAGVLREAIGGVDFYMFLRGLTDNFDTRFDDLSLNLSRVAKQIFSSANVLSFAGSVDAMRSYADASSELFSKSDVEGAMRAGLYDVEGPDDGRPNLSPQCLMEIPAPRDLHEAFVVPSDVTYTAMAASRKNICGPITGAWFVAAKVLSLDYLWNEVRVKGGAYGVGFTSTRPGATYFSSFRDPHIDETLERFQGAGAWLSSFYPTEEELVGYIVSSVAAFDAPLKPRDLIRRQDGMFFCDYTQKERLGYRCEVVNVDSEKIRSLGPAIEEICERRHICSVGNSEIIASCSENYNVLEIMPSVCV